MVQLNSGVNKNARWSNMSAVNQFPLAAKLMQSLAKGRICRAKWHTKDGSLREARIRLFSKDGFTYEDRVLENPVAHLGKYITCEDIDKKKESGDSKGGWINIAFERLVEVQADGELHTVDLS